MVKYFTNGQHSKAYSPWGFPKDSCPDAQRVLDEYYDNFNEKFVCWYYGPEESGEMAADSTDPWGDARYDTMPEEYRKRKLDKIFDD